MKAERRKFSASFKAQVALSATQEREDMTDLSKRYGVPYTVIFHWKKESLGRPL